MSVFYDMVNIEQLQKCRAESERLRAALEDAIDTLEAMDLHIDNPLYERLRNVLESPQG